MAMIILKPRLGAEIKRVGHKFILLGKRKICSVRHRVYPLFRGNFVSDKADTIFFQFYIVTCRAIVIKKRSHHFIRSGAVSHAVEHIQNDPIILAAKSDHMII